MSQENLTALVNQIVQEAVAASGISYNLDIDVTERNRDIVFRLTIQPGQADETIYLMAFFANDHSDADVIRDRILYNLRHHFNVVLPT